MKSVIELLRKNEWTRGNGQCDECGGRGPKMFCLMNYEKSIRYDHFHTVEPRDIGHREGCLAAKSLNDLGEYTIIRD